MLESDLEQAKQQIEAEKAALAAAHDEITQLKVRLGNFRVKFQATSSELEETKVALYFLRQSHACKLRNVSDNFVIQLSTKEKI